MAVTANQLTVRADGYKVGYPVAASTTLYQGTLAFANSSGYLDDDTATGVNSFAGINIDYVDNSSGSNGDLSADVWKKGEFLLTGSGFAQTSVGLRVYATDNYTITTTNSSSAVYIGICTGYVSSTKIYVSIDTATTEGTVTDSLTTQVITFDGATGVNEIRVPTNLADALSLEVSGVGDVLTLDTSTGAIVLASAAAVRFNVLGDFQGGNATTDLVAFHGSTPTDQCAAYTQTYSTADRTHANPTASTLTVTDGAGTNDNTIGAITADASVIAAVQEIVDEVNKLIADVADVKQIVNAVIDDLQEKGLVG